MKKFILICLSFFMFSTSFTVYADEEYKENSWRYENGEPIASQDEISYARSSVNAWSKQDGVIYNSLGDPIPNAISKGIDVSEWQGDIDWNKVKNTDVEFAIIRCGFAGDYTKYDDKKFQRNVSECQRLGIPFGIYLYSYAETVEDAKSEAAHVLRLLNGMQLSYPVFYDLEENNVMATVSKSTIANIAKTFVNTVESKGYSCGIYANLYWFNNFLTDSYFDTVTKWVAQYNTECTYTKPFSMWQATSSGYVNGIQGNVDINIGFDSMKKNGWVNENGNWYYYSNDEQILTNQWIGNYYVGSDGKMLTNKWIGNCYVDATGLWKPNKWMNDGQWWFRYGDGSYPKGKFEVLDGSTYYFNNEGYMVTGWKSIKNDWYYFNASGAMAKSQWIGNYYLGKDGKMIKSQWVAKYYMDASGVWQPDRWINNGQWWYRYGDGSYPIGKFDVIGNNVYYFNNLGYMVTGWQEIDGEWYYFNASGSMEKNTWIGNYYLGPYGQMLKNQWIGNYYVGSNGCWIA